MHTPAQYCPVAIATEVFGDRWTPLILREMVIGATRFTEIERGMPGVSRALLTQRLRGLETQGIIERTVEPAGYRLTPAGKDLEPIVWALGEWAIRWSLSDPVEEQLDNNLLLWRMQEAICPENAPRERTVVQFDIAGPGRGSSRYWLLIEDAAATVCQRDPGAEALVIIDGTSMALHRWWLGRVEWGEALREGSVRVDGPAALTRAFPTWFHRSPFAAKVRAART